MAYREKNPRGRGKTVHPSRIRKNVARKETIYRPKEKDLIAVGRLPEHPKEK